MKMGTHTIFLNHCAIDKLKVQSQTVTPDWPVMCAAGRTI